MIFKEPVEDYISKKGWKYEVKGNELYIQFCPYCQESATSPGKAHLHMSAESGAFHCKKCNTSGSIWKFKQDAGDFTPPAAAVPKVFKTPMVDVVSLNLAMKKSETAKKFLSNRKLLKEDVLEHFRIGWDKDRKAIAIPYFENGKVVNVKYRLVLEKGFQKESDCKSTLLNIQAIDHEQPILITEGEFDAMAAWLLGFKNVVSLPDGASSVKSAESLVSVKAAIFIATDNDEQGQSAAEKIALLLGASRCRRVVIPKEQKDFNGFLMAGGTAEGATELIQNAQPFVRPELLSAADAVELYRRKLLENDTPSMSSGWKSIDTLLGGLRPGEVTTLTADTGIGKSTWAQNLCDNLMKNNNGILIFESEMTPFRVMGKFYSIHAGKHEPTLRNVDIRTHFEISYPDKVFQAEDLQECQNYYKGKKLWMWNRSGDMPLWKIQDQIVYAAAYLDVNLVVIDHLHHFIYSDNPDHERHSIEKFMKRISETAETTGTHIVIICHPSKEIGIGGHVHMNHLKGSSAIKQDSSNVISLSRNRDTQSKYVECWIQKVRDDSGNEGMTVFAFDKHTQRYTETQYRRLKDIEDEE